MKNGDSVTIVVKTPLATTEEPGVIESIDENLIYIRGLRIPFMKSTGKKVDNFFGADVYIKEICKK